MAIPCTLITSCCEFSPENIVKEILKTESLENGEHLLEDITGYKWLVDTKYYTADVLLCTTKQRSIGTQEFAEAVQGFIVYFDPAQESSFEQMKSWLPYLDQIEPEIKMLVCNRCTENHKVSRQTALQWCIENSFELVELDPEEDSDSEDDFAETTGMKRIVQALHAHTWPNLILKGEPSVQSPYIRQLMQEQFNKKKANADKRDKTAENIPKGDHSNIPNLKKDNSESEVVNCKDNTDTSTANSKSSNETEIDSVTHPVSQVKQSSCDKVDDKSTIPRGSSGEPAGAVGGNEASGDSKGSVKTKSSTKQPTKEERLDSLFPDMSLLDELEEDESGGESFEQLFQNFGQMRDRAKDLPPEERRDYAEKVAVAFWRAMGGDEDEIEGLSDSDTEQQQHGNT